MQVQSGLICDRIYRLVEDMNSYIDYLYISQCMYSRNMILGQLKGKIQELEFISGILCEQLYEVPPGSTEALPRQRTFSLEELSNYNGKNGNPAYVAVNGNVYDVTNNAAWAAATHFGLNAGRDLTNEFASCHAGQQILGKLNIVGRLVL